MVHARDTILDAMAAYPSLIGCLQAREHGFYLDIALPEPYRHAADDGIAPKGPFSRTIEASIRTDGGDGVQDVLLILQSDRYQVSDALVSIRNTDVETAWQNAFAFHHQSPNTGKALFFRDQINASGQLLPFRSLFVCLESKRWFHPLCPECGLELTLCRDDALLKDNGLPAYADSLERFLFCPACSARSAAASFYVAAKKADMPEVVLDAADLVARWHRRSDPSRNNPLLPCEGCERGEGGYGSDRAGPARIVPFSFYPFYMLMFPAPSCDAATFMRLLSGGRAAVPKTPPAAMSACGGDRFLFQDQRRFLEILYLKLTFLDQVIRQFIPANGSQRLQDVGLSLEGIGVDLHPPGTGLPAYWNFNTRILDAIGSLKHSPFAPVIPEAPYCHFLGAVWFRVLLVNQSQRAGTVYAAVGTLVDNHPNVSELSADDLGLTDPAGVFAANNLFDEPHGHAAVRDWQAVWLQAIRLGLELVRAGVKTGTRWDREAFMDSLTALRNQTKTTLFASNDVHPAAQPLKQADRIRDILGTILEKWQTAADTIDHQAAAQPVAREPDMDDLERTMVISPFPGSTPSSRAGTGGDGADDVGRRDADAPDLPADGADEALAATRIIDPAEPPPSSPRFGEDDPDATLIIDRQGQDPATRASSADRPDPDTPAPDSNADDIMEQTVIIRSDTREGK